MAFSHEENGSPNMEIRMLEKEEIDGMQNDLPARPESNSRPAHPSYMTHDDQFSGSWKELVHLINKNSKPDDEYYRQLGMMVYGLIKRDEQDKKDGLDKGSTCVSFLLVLKF